MKKKKYTLKHSLTNKMVQEKFDRGEDVSADFDWKRAQTVGPIQRVNVDFPNWAVLELDQEAERRNISRQALIKHWVIEHLDDLRNSSNASAPAQNLSRDRHK